MKLRHTLPLVVLGGLICGCDMDNQKDSTIVQSQKITDSQKTDVVSITPEELIQPLPEGHVPKNVCELQRRIYTEFSNSIGFGHRRMASSHDLPVAKDRYLLYGAWLKFHDVADPKNRGVWEVANVQLLGVTNEPTGRVYLTKKDDEYTRLYAKSKDVKTRPLDEFEEASIEKFRYGSNIEVHYPPNQPETMRMVGAIRAVSQVCMNCHKAEKHELLGAFSYDLKRAKW